MDLIEKYIFRNLINEADERKERGKSQELVNKGSISEWFFSKMVYMKIRLKFCTIECDLVRLYRKNWEIKKTG